MSKLLVNNGEVLPVNRFLQQFQSSLSKANSIPPTTLNVYQSSSIRPRQYTANDSARNSENARSLFLSDFPNSFLWDCPTFYENERKGGSRDVSKITSLSKDGKNTKTETSIDQVENMHKGAHKVA
jgi:hypothetical protein